MTPTDSTTSALDPTAPPAAAAVVDPLAEPTFEECQLEWIRYHADRTAGRVSFAGIPEGHHVAYFGRRIIDHDADHMTLLSRVASSVGVHWARLVIDYPWMRWQEEIAREAADLRQHDALIRLNEQLTSLLNGLSLREDRVSRATVREWLHGLLGIVEGGLAKGPLSQSVSTPVRKNP